MKPLSDREKKVIAETYDTVFGKDKQPTRDEMLKFILRVMDYDRKQMASWGLKHAAGMLAMITHSKKDIGRYLHPDALVATMLLTSLMIPKLTRFMRQQASAFMDEAGIAYTQETCNTRLLFEERYGFNEDVYVKFLDRLSDESTASKLKEAFNHDQELVTAMAEKAGFKRVDIDVLPDDVRNALVKMGLDPNKIHVINIEDDDGNDTPSTH